MKTGIILLLLLALVLPIAASQVFVLNSVSGTLSKIDTATGTVNNQFATLGTQANRMAVANQKAYVVNSGDNSVQVINLQTGQTTGNIFIGASSNPWEIYVDNDKAYVTGLFTNKVYKLDLNTMQVVGNVTVGTAPEGMCMVAGKLYVGNTGGYQNNYTPSTVSVVNIESMSVEATIPVEVNPQYLFADNGMIHVACTGNWNDISGKVCVIDPSTNSVVQTIAIGGNLGNIWISTNHIAYIAEAMNTGLYAYNTENYSVLFDASHSFTPGGSCVWGSSNQIAVVNAEWGQNGHINIFDNNLQLQGTYTVAMSPTDVRFLDEEISNDDPITQPILCQVYPNPMRSTLTMKWTSDARSLSIIELYNLKGQRIKSWNTVTNSVIWDGKDSDGNQVPSGIYMYRIKQTVKTIITGKITKLN